LPEARNFNVYKTRFCDVTIVSDGDAIVGLWLRDVEIPGARRETSDLTDRVAGQLEEYFDGRRLDFDVAIRPSGTEFQMDVWKALLEIPYGETRSYSDIAESIGRPRACRAVGMANNRNPISIIIPCHRVIGADGSLVGYGGGLDMKQKLLDLENGRYDLWSQGTLPPECGA